MKNKLIAVVLASVAILPSCGVSRNVVSFTDARGGDYDRVVSVVGNIEGETLKCSSAHKGGRQCIFRLYETDGEESLTFSLMEGNGGDNVETTDVNSNTGSVSTFNVAQIKIRGSNGNVIDLTNSVTVTGKTTILAASPPTCTLDDVKISQ